MKKQLINWLAIAMLLFIGVGMISCGKDNDEGEAGIGSIKVNGYTYSLNHAWWGNNDIGAFGDRVRLCFSDIDYHEYYSLNWSTVKILTLIIWDKTVKELTPGTYQADVTFSILESTYSNGSPEIDHYNSKLTINISKSGDNYTISVPKTQIYDKKDTLVPFSFNYTGSIPKENIPFR